MDYEKKKEERRKAAAQKKRDKKKQKKKKKSSGKQTSNDNNEQDDDYEKDDEDYEGFPFVGTDQRMPLVINGKRPVLVNFHLMYNKVYIYAYIIIYFDNTHLFLLPY